MTLFTVEFAVSGHSETKLMYSSELCVAELGAVSSLFRVGNSSKHRIREGSGVTLEQLPVPEGA